MSGAVVSVIVNNFVGVPFQQVRVLPEDGYGSLVSELGQGWQQLLDQIAAEVRKGA